MPKTTLLERIHFLSHELEIPPEQVIAKAIEPGVCALYRHRMGERYVSGDISRDTAMHLLGPHEVARLECVMHRLCELAEDEIDLICGHA